MGGTRCSGLGRSRSPADAQPSRDLLRRPRPSQPGHRGAGTADDQVQQASPNPPVGAALPARHPTTLRPESTSICGFGSDPKSRISGPGVRVQDLKEDRLANYRFRYSSLSPLVFFPEGWSRDNQRSLGSSMRKGDPGCASRARDVPRDCAPTPVWCVDLPRRGPSTLGRDEAYYTFESGDRHASGADS